MRLGRDGIAGLIGLVVSLLQLPQVVGLPKLPIVPVGPGFYAGIVLVFMALLSAILVVQDVVAQRRAGAAIEEPMVAPSRAYGLVIAAFAIIGVYIGLMPLLGFRVATVLFVAAFQLALERPTTLRQWAVLLAIAVATALLSNLVFERYLLVLLPHGIWTGW